jgi:hypothetical protein
VVIFVRATGGMSRAVGGLCALDAGAEVWGMRPVRTIGGWRSVDIAMACQFRIGLIGLGAITILTRFIQSMPMRCGIQCASYRMY